MMKKIGGMGEVKVDVNNLMPLMTVKVTLVGVRRWRLRIFVGMLLVRLGVRITGMRVEVA